MGDYPVGSRKSDFQSAPRAFVGQTNGPPGQSAVLTVGAGAIALDLTQGLCQLPLDRKVSGQDPKSPARNCLSIESDVDIGIIFGPSLAAVSGVNAPSLTAAGTVSGAGVYQGAPGTCWLVKAAVVGTPTRFLLQAGLDNAIGIVGTGAGKVRIYQSSPDDA